MENNKVINKYSIEKVKEMILQSLWTSADLDYIAQELGEDILPKFLNGSEKDKKQLRGKFDEKMTALSQGMGLETHFPLMECVDERYRAFAKDMSKKLCQEYKCSTVLEKALVETITNSIMAL